MQNKFQILQPWLFQILDTLKREIKHEHLSKNPSFYRTYFGTRPLNRIHTEEFLAAYEKELLQGNEDLSEWVINRWVFNHGEIYDFFAERLSQINPEFGEIESLNEEQSGQILAGAAESFGSLPVYIFSILNGVVFPEAVLEKLRKAAEGEEAKVEAEKKELAERENLEQIVERHQREMMRLKEKCEDRISGVMKKYAVDVEALKKQVRALQQRVK